MLIKEYLQSQNKAKVTFELADYEIPGDIEAATVHLVGEFNDWDLQATPMKHSKKGSFRVVLELEPGREYRFKYLVNGKHWCNDWSADAYIPDGYGSDNSVVTTPGKKGSS